MHYIGIDIAKYNHVVGVLKKDGTPVGNARSFTNDFEGFSDLLRRLAELKVRADDSIVVMEATGHYWMALYVFLVDHGFDVAVVNPALINAFRKSDTLRKTKTNAIDAFLIAKFAKEKEITASPATIEATDGLKQLTRYRRHLVKEQTMLKNKCTAVIDRVFPESCSRTCTAVRRKPCSRPTQRPPASPQRTSAPSPSASRKAARDAWEGEGRKGQGRRQGLRRRPVRLLDARLRDQPHRGPHRAPG